MNNKVATIQNLCALRDSVVKKITKKYQRNVTFLNNQKLSIKRLNQCFLNKKFLRIQKTWLQNDKTKKRKPLTCAFIVLIRFS